MLDGVYWGKTEPRGRSARELKAKAESKAKPEIKQRRVLERARLKLYLKPCHLKYTVVEAKIYCFTVAKPGIR